MSEIPLQQKTISENDYDLDTGLLKEEIEIEQLKIATEKVIDQAISFKEMKNTKGWSLLELFIRNTTQEMTKSLIIERDFAKIQRLQAEIIAFESLPNLLTKSFEEAEEAKKLLLDIIGPSNDDNPIKGDINGRDNL